MGLFFNNKKKEGLSPTHALHFLHFLSSSFVHSRFKLLLLWVWVCAFVRRKWRGGVLTALTVQRPVFGRVKGFLYFVVELVAEAQLKGSGVLPSTV